MVRKCCHCTWTLDTKTLLNVKGIIEIRCPNCGRKLKATALSLYMWILIATVIFCSILILPFSDLTVLSIEIIWVVFSINILPAIIVVYEEL